MPLLVLKNLSKVYANQPVVLDVNLNLEEGEILCLLGPSGCGKTTLLRMIAGLEIPDSGQVIFKDQDFTIIAPHQRRFGLMFQEYALFPHKSVLANVAFGLSVTRQPSATVQERAMAMLELVGMTAMANRNVADLSGGERQRVALARSLAPHPRLLMLDEPLGSLDRALRERLLLEIRRILKKMHMTTIFVTHDQSEALAVADQIAVMNAGRLEQVAPPEDLYRRPQTRFTARFLGFDNLLAGTVCTNSKITTPHGVFTLPAGTKYRNGDRVTLILRPEAARLTSDTPSKKTPSSLTGQVTERFFTGQTYRVSLETDDRTVFAFELPNEPAPPRVGARIALTISPTSLSVIQEAV